MKPILFLAVLSFVILVAANGAVELGDDFETVISQQPALLDLYAEWCGHCKKLAPVFDELADSIGDRNILIAKIDATKVKPAANKFNVRGFPTIVYVDGEYVKEYSGPRTVEGFLSFIDKLTGNPILDLPSDIKFNKETSYFLIPKDLSLPQLDMVTVEARNNVEFSPFYFVSEEQLKEHCGTRDQICAIRDGKPVLMELNDNKVSEFISQNLFGALPEISQENFKQLAEGNILFIAALEPRMEEKREEIRSKVEKSSAKFAWMDAVKFKGYLERIGLNLDELPAFFALDVVKRKMWKVPVGGENFDYLLWSEGVVSGKINPDESSTAYHSLLAKINMFAHEHLTLVIISVVGLGVLLGIVLKSIAQKRRNRIAQEEEDKTKED
ncbi:hypothetical protein RCL1_005800 [Eukaryota sp. TZLM3-RCL]